jgi:hypothetical protein
MYSLLHRPIVQLTDYPILKTWQRREIKPIPIAEGQLNLFDLDSPET